MYSFYNPNPFDLRVGDCSIRAVAKATDISWDDAFKSITAQAYSMADMPSSDAVWGAYLRSQGFNRYAVPNRCPDCYTAGDFAREHPHGTYVLAFGGHVATVKDGVLYDSWDSTGLIPQYYWYREG